MSHQESPIRRLLTFLLSTSILTALACAPAPTTPPSSEPLGQALDAVFEPWNRTDSPGAAVVVLKDGEPLYRRGFGMASLELDEPIDPSRTQFDIGSISKQMAAYAVLLLEQQGLLNLDDDVRVHLPWIPDLGASFSVRRLLDHTSGLREYLTLADLHKNADPNERGEALKQGHLRRWLKDQRGLSFSPGEKHMYSNTGFFLAAELVEAASGRPYHEFMAQEVFEPLGMTQTRVRRFGDGWRLPTRSYAPGQGLWARLGGGFDEVPVIWQTWGAGGIASTVDDLAIWGEHLRSGHGTDLVRAMTTRGQTLDGETFDYGLGIRRTMIHGNEVVWHGGSGMAFYGWLGYVPEHGVTVALLQNNHPGVGRVDQRLLKPIFEHLGILEETSEELAQGPFDKWTGHYANDTFRLQLKADEGRLSLVSTTRGALPVEVLSDGRLRSPISDLFTQLDADGKVEAIGFWYGAQRETLPRFRPIDPSTIDFDSLAGEYRVPELNQSVHLSASEGRLILDLGDGLSDWLGDQRLVYVPTLPNRFHIEAGSASSITFTYDESGQVDGALLNLIRSHNILMEKL